MKKIVFVLTQKSTSQVLGIFSSEAKASRNVIKLLLKISRDQQDLQCLAKDYQILPFRLNRKYQPKEK